MKLDVHVATGPFESESAEGTLHQIGAALGVDWHFTDGPLEPAIGVGLIATQYSGDFTESQGRTLSLADTLVGAQVRAGARYWVSDQLAFGGEARVTAYLINNQTVDMTLGVTYAGF